MDEEKESTEKKMDLSKRIKGEGVKSPMVDITPYIGKKALIMSAETFESHRYNKVGYYTKVITDDIDHVTLNNKEIVIKASKIMGFSEDAKGNLGWNEDTKLGQFLKRMNAKTLKDLIGKEVIVQATENRKFLTF